MPRPYWSGQIQISLVSFGVSFFTATEAKSNISFHQIVRSTGERVRHQKVAASSADSGSGEAGDVVAKDEIVKGYEYSKGQYVLIEPGELENLRVPSKHVIAVSQFADLSDLNPEFVEKPYFVTPENDGQAEAFATVREALLKTKKAAIGTIAFSGRESIVAITADPNTRGMMAYTLRYQNELRNHQDYFRDIKAVEVGDEMLDMAEALITKKAAKFDLGKFQDGYEGAVKELVDAKLQNLPIPKDEAPRAKPSNVVNLMDALRKSVNGDAQAKKMPPKKPVVSAKEPARKGIGLVKPVSKATAPKRKSA